ncbi:uncharacterized protein LOC129247380 [Anastrepha obliqua]|uniref:uncharacterized protein LOC129247380 n=1 Tax=Anastrepha obliqua TaxID=95512 RepID=UPI00240A036A|nr:uncharacterized protein LOC129247380 [Anastrepha obliqua]
MAKLHAILILGICLALQGADAVPVKSSAADGAEGATVNTNEGSTTIGPNEAKSLDANAADISSEESESESEYPDELMTLLGFNDTKVFRLLMSNYIDLQKFSNAVINISHDFLEVSLKTLSTLPDEKSAGIQRYITRMNRLKKDIDELDMSPISFEYIGERSDILEEFSGLYDDFSKMVFNGLSESDVAVLKELFDKIDLKVYMERIDAALEKTVKKLAKLEDKFFSNLNAEEKQKYAPLVEWYDKFKERKSDQEKLRDASDFNKYLFSHRFR